MSLNRPLRSKTVREEGGAVLILFALTLTLLIGFMALAVDASHAFVERRGSQSAADVAVIAGALQTIPNSTNKEALLVAEAMRLVNINIGIPIDGNEWAGCDDNDADVLPITWASFGGSSDCISWEPGFTTVRVRVPGREIKTFFGQVIGLTSITVGAAAEAEVIADDRGGVLPFGVLGNADNSVLCLKTGSGNGIPLDCENNGTGNFHYIDFKTFGNAAVGTSAECGQANKPQRLKENIAHGVDHDLYRGEPNVPGNNAFDAGVCNGTAAIDPTAADNGVSPHPGATGAGAEQGTISGVVLEGLVQGITVNGRFHQGRLNVPSGGVPYKGVTIDDTGLWNHLTDGARSACKDLVLPEDHVPPMLGTWTAISDIPDTEVETISCIVFHSETGQSIMFDTDSLSGSVRFGWVPILWQNSWPTGNSSPVSFKMFQPMYIQTMFGGKCFSDGTCETSIVPGETWLGAGGKTPNALTAIKIPGWAVEPSLQDPKDRAPKVLGYSLSR